MNYRKFGGTDWQVSEIGLGTWQLGADWGSVDDTTAENVLAAAIDSGVNFFDTADCYGEGLSETRLGKFLKNSSKKVYIATKLGRFPKPGGSENFSLSQFRQHTQESLKRLGGECLDLTQVHCPPTEIIKQGEVFDWLRTLKKEGKIKEFGLSVESMEEAELCLKQDGVASLQIIFNVLRQKPIETIFNLALKKKVALIVRLPLASGLLSGNFSKTTHFSANDHRNFNRDGEHFNVGETFSGLPYEKGLELVNQLEAMTPQDIPLALTALRWILDFESVSVVIPGSKNPEQVRRNCSASDLPVLTASLHETLKNFYKQDVESSIRGKY
ncbi:MAG: aldo/keto reductase [Nitrospinae bacterium]|nr:aldo/keto reductase [Nitrospinota bacterium]